MSNQPSHVKVINKPTREHLEKQLEHDLDLLNDLINNPDKWTNIYEAKHTYQEVMRIVSERTDMLKRELAKSEGPEP